MPRVLLADSFAESRQILKCRDHAPTAMADQYRFIGKQLGVDFSPTIRVLDMLPVFLSGPRHAKVRRAMAVGIAAARERQHDAAQQVIDRLPALLAPGRRTELMAAFVRPLWQAMAEANGDGDPAQIALVDDITRLFDSRLRLRQRLQINEQVRAFIDAAPESAERRLLALGQNVLGIGPFTGSMAMSLHHVFSSNLDRPLAAIRYPASYPLSALPVTDRIVSPATDEAKEAKQAAEAVADEVVVKRCLLHSTQFSVKENEEALYGMGAHACLGRPIAGAVWSMVVAKLAGLEGAIQSSALTLAAEAPESEEDYLTLTDPFVRPQGLHVQTRPLPAT